MQRLNDFLCNDFIFSPRYRVWRHVCYWSFHITIWATFWVAIGTPVSFGRHLFNMSLWVPVFILFSYPLVYGAIPHLLLKGKVSLFLVLVLLWAIVGLYIDEGFRHYILIPLQEAMGLSFILPRGPLPFCYLCMTTSAASPMIIKFFKLCTIKQRDWMLAEQEKLNTELQLMKAQVHPHFLYNTLNNLYTFSKARSPKTPGLILKLSSLLSHMLYDCSAEEVRLEKEIEMMKSYIDLEKERHGDRLDVSWSVEGNTGDSFTAPLLLLPFLENAFKHGVTGQIEKPWLSVDITVGAGALRCKIINSKDELLPYSGAGHGIANVKKRLAFHYAGRHDLKLNDEGNFFVVSLLLKLAPAPYNTALPRSMSHALQHTTPRHTFEAAN